MWYHVRKVCISAAAIGPAAVARFHSQEDNSVSAVTPGASISVGNPVLAPKMMSTGVPSGDPGQGGKKNENNNRVSGGAVTIVEAKRGESHEPEQPKRGPSSRDTKAISGVETLPEVSVKNEQTADAHVFFISKINFIRIPKGDTNQTGLKIDTNQPNDNMINMIKIACQCLQ